MHTQERLEAQTAVAAVPGCVLSCDSSQRNLPPTVPTPPACPRHRPYCRSRHHLHLVCSPLHLVCSPLLVCSRLSVAEMVPVPSATWYGGGEGRKRRWRREGDADGTLRQPPCGDMWPSQRARHPPRRQHRKHAPGNRQGRGDTPCNAHPRWPRWERRPFHLLWSGHARRNESSMPVSYGRVRSAARRACGVGQHQSVE